LPYLSCNNTDWSSGATCIDDDQHPHNWTTNDNGLEEIGTWEYDEVGLTLTEQDCASQHHDQSCSESSGHHEGIYVNNSYPRYSTQDYWFNHVLHWSKDVAMIGKFQTTLVTAFTIAWVIVFIYFSKFFTAFRKVVYFTPSFPYIILIACLTGSLALEGSKEGIKEFLIPDFAKLKNIKIWRDAVIQVSMGEINIGDVYTPKSSFSTLIVRNFPCRTLKISKASLVVMGS
jgi:hypothetical protein